MRIANGNVTRLRILLRSRAHSFFSGLTISIGIILLGVAMTGGGSSRPVQAASVQSSTVTKTTSNHWLMTTSLISSMASSDSLSAQWFFNTPNAFAMTTKQSGFSATPIANYKSYAQFSADLTSGTFPAGVQWVMYDNESWSATPTIESQHPALYMEEFADLAHQHNLKVIEVPARDLVDVAGADCVAQSSETMDQAYLRCGIPADAQYADIFSIQAQGDQPSVSDYASLVMAAKNQVVAKTPAITVLSGLTTDRGDSATQIYNCWLASHANVSGYWMNTGTTTLPVAEQVMDQIRSNRG